MNQTQKYLVFGFIVVILTIISMVAITYKHNHPLFLTEPNYKPYQDSILAFKNNIKVLQIKEDSLAHVDSTLQVVKNKITQQYYEKVKHISIASTQQLDSIITVELR